MRKLTINLQSFTDYDEFELLEVSRRKRFKDGEATDKFDTVYKVLINYEPIEIKVSDDGSIAEKSEEVAIQRQLGNPLPITFKNALIVISPKSQYEMMIRGTADEATLSEAK